jgi:hypothetical protein
VTRPSGRHVVRILVWIVANPDAGPNGLGGHAPPAVWDLDLGLELREPWSGSVVRAGRGARRRTNCGRHMLAFTCS